MPECWRRVEKAQLELPAGFKNELINPALIKKVPVVKSTGPEKSDVHPAMNIQGPTWNKLHLWALKFRLINTAESELLTIASQIPLKYPSVKQADELWEIRKKLLRVGYPER